MRYVVNFDGLVICRVFHEVTILSDMLIDVKCYYLDLSKYRHKSIQFFAIACQPSNHVCYRISIE